MARQNIKTPRPRTSSSPPRRIRSGSAARRKTHSRILAFFQTANSRAQQRSNQRNWKSRGMKSVNASIAKQSDDIYNLPIGHLILRTLIGIFLIFPCFISTLAIFEINSLPSSTGSFWQELIHTEAFLFFGIGCFLMMTWFWSKVFRKKFLYVYVLGHELTHAFFILVCGGKVSGFKVTPDGGYVITNKTNVLIALSPYFIPFWTCFAVGVSHLLGLFFQIPYHDEILYFIIGFTWTFHLAWTIWMIPRDQPDLKENGSFFSLTIIYLANILLLATLLCLSPTGINFKSYCYQWINLFIDHSLALISWVKSFEILPLT